LYLFHNRKREKERTSVASAASVARKEVVQ